MNTGKLFEKYYMKQNGLWNERIKEAKEKGFDNASPIARLIYSCEIGEINQHASEDLKMISAALAVGYDLESDNAQLHVRITELEGERDMWRNFFFTIVAPDGFMQQGMYQECPICEQEKEHAEDCPLAAALGIDKD